MIRKLNKRQEYGLLYNTGLKQIILRHYSAPYDHPCCVFPGCEETRLEELTLDHINGGGNAERERVCGRYSRGFPNFYHYLLREGFPSGYQTLCKFHNYSKPIENYEEREACEEEEYARTHPTLWALGFDYSNPIPNAQAQPLWEVV